MSPLLNLRNFSPFQKKIKAVTPVAPSLNFSPANGIGGMSPAQAPNMSVAPRPAMPNLLSSARNLFPMPIPKMSVMPKTAPAPAPAPAPLAKTVPNKPVVPVLPPQSATISPAVAPKLPPASILPTTGGLSPATVQTAPRTAETPNPTAPVVPTVPAPTPEAPKSITTPEYDAATKEYESNIGLSTEEIAVQEELNRIKEATTGGMFTESQRAIPMGIITGQQKAIEQRGLNLQAPLSDRMALLQAKRLGALDASKFRVEQEGKKIELAQTSQQNAAESAESARRFGIEQKGEESTRSLAEKKLNEDTRRTDLDYKLSQEKLDEDTRRFGLEYAIKQRDQALQERKAISDAGGGSGNVSADGYVPGINPTVDAWKKLIESGDRVPSDVPANLRNDVAIAMGSTDTTAKKVVELDRNLGLIDEILASPYLKQVTGVGNPLTYWTPGSNEQYVKSQLAQLRSMLTVNAREKLKGQGTITDKEMAVLEAAETALGGALGDKDAVKEIKKIQDSLVERKNALVGESQQSQQMKLPDGTVVTRQSDGTYN